MLPNDNPTTPRIWLDVARDLLVELVANPKTQVTEEHPRAVRTFYSFHYLQQQVLFGRELTHQKCSSNSAFLGCSKTDSKFLTDKIYESNRRLSFIN